jgi:2-aminoadipate transaminase
LYEPTFHSIPTDENGIDTARLEQTLASQDAKLIYCMPNFQNPSGISYSEARRADVGRIARKSSALIVEDDPYGQLRFRGAAPSMLAHHLPERTILMGSFSKTISPGMRMGWLVVPKQLMEKLVIAKQAADLHSNYLSQRIIHRFLIDNDFEAHLQRLRASYQRQCDAMIHAIEMHFPREIRFTRPDGGMFLWVTLPAGLSAMKLFELAIARSVCFVPGAAFHACGGGENTLRLNFSNCEEQRIQIGIQRLAEAINLLPQSGPAAVSV